MKIDSTTSVVDRLVARLSEDAGGLLNDEDLGELVAAAVQKAFFEPRRVKDGYIEKTVEPLLVEMVREIMREQIREALKRWLVDNAELMYAQWRKVFDVSVEEYVLDCQRVKMSEHVADILQNAFDTLNKEREKVGLPDVGVSFRRDTGRK